jgi:hypothetical protein
MRRLARVAFLALVVPVTAACGARSGADAAALARDRTPRIEDAFDDEPALLIAVRPQRIAHDPLYGPLLRRVSELASARVAVGQAVGKTALSALERTEEIVIGAYDRDARDAVIGLRGVPADVEASGVLDTNGKPLWVHVRDLPAGVEELAPADTTEGGALFVLPRRAWVITVGEATDRTRGAFVQGVHPGGASLALDSAPLAVARLRGAALLRARPKLADGALAPLVRDLDVVTLSLAPGPEGEVGEVAIRLVYGDAVFAERAEACAVDVLAAFSRKLEASAPWLHAVKVSREERALVVRGRIPRGWADGLLHVDLDDVAR